MTPQEIQSYSVKMAEMMAAPSRIDTKDLKTVYYQFNEFPEDKGWWSSDYMKFHTSYDWQIKVWQKVYAKLKQIDISGNGIKEQLYRLRIRDLVYLFHIAIDSGTPLDSFAIICKAIDTIETKK